MASFDVQDRIAALVAILTTGLVPAQLNFVYPHQPRAITETPPVAWVEYVAGSSTNPTPFGFAGQPSTRVWSARIIAAQHLISELDLADAAAKAAVGPMYRLIRNNPTLGGTVDHAIISADRIAQLPVGAAGARVFHCNIFDLQVTEFMP